MKNLFLGAVLSSFASAAFAQGEAAQTLFQNVHVFDGLNEERLEDAFVLVEGNQIIEISSDPIEAEGAMVIDGAGRTLMPGLIDMHSHLAMAWPSLLSFESATWEGIGARTALIAEATLMDGFTTVRDAGGMNGKGVKK